MRRAVRLVTVGLIALAAGVIAGRAAQSVSQQSAAAPSPLPPTSKAAEAQATASTEKNVDLVRFSFGDTHFAIPRRYLDGAPHFPGGNEPAFFRLFLTLPDLLPATREDLSAMREGHGLGRVLLAWVSYKSPVRSGEDLLSIMLDGIDPNRHSTDQYGSMVYDLPRSNRAVHVWRKENFLFFLTCDRRSPFKDSAIPFHAACDVQEKLWDQLDIRYFYSKKFLPYAVSTDQKLRALLSSFR